MTQDKKVKHCENCGVELFNPQTRFHGEMVTCGSSECDREARNSELQQREEAHEQLDIDLGWS